MWPELQTTCMTYQQIMKGERPWNALGDFLNYWFGYAPGRREELVQDPILEPGDVTAELHQWAVFCAASVEYLCQHSNLPCPDWVTAPTYYRLSEPWFTGLGAHKQEVQARLLQETPEPFSRRNIYCGNRVLANKVRTRRTLVRHRSLHAFCVICPLSRTSLAVPASTLRRK